MYDYNEYEDDEVINESALDMAIDMSDRYGVAIEDAYDFACDAMEGSLKDPKKRTLREVGRTVASAKTAKNAVDEYDRRSMNDYDWDLKKHPGAHQSPLLKPRRAGYRANAVNAVDNLKRDNARLEKAAGLTYRNERLEWLK